jgi:transposase
MDQQRHYVGLDVSLETTSICVIDDAGAIIWRGKCRSDPDTITAIVRQHAPGAVRVGLETGQLSNWLTLSLRRRGVPVVCMDARHAKAALSLQINKTDANDALGLAQVVRTGWYREVAVKSMDAHTLRMLLVARSRIAAPGNGKHHPRAAQDLWLGCRTGAAKACFLCAFVSRLPEILH